MSWKKQRKIYLSLKTKAWSSDGMSEQTISKHKRYLRVAVSDSGPLCHAAAAQADMCIYGERK